MLPARWDCTADAAEMEGASEGSNCPVGSTSVPKHVSICVARCCCSVALLMLKRTKTQAQGTTEQQASSDGGQGTMEQQASSAECFYPFGIALLMLQRWGGHRCREQRPGKQHLGNASA